MSTALGWLLATVGWLATLAIALLVTRYIRDITRHRYALALADWAEWTTLTVTERGGNLNTYPLSALYDLHRSGEHTDFAWTTPVSVGLWTADLEDLYRAWHQEIDNNRGIPDV